MIDTDEVRGRLSRIEDIAKYGIRRAYADNHRAYSKSGWQVLIDSVWAEFAIDLIGGEQWRLHLGYATFTIVDFIRFELDRSDNADVEIRNT